MPILCLILIYR